MVYLSLNIPINVTADFWVYLTGSQGPETSTLANQAVLMILVLINHCNNPRNPYRETFSLYSGIDLPSSIFNIERQLARTLKDSIKAQN